MVHKIESNRLFFYFFDFVACVSSCVVSKLGNSKLAESQIRSLSIFDALTVVFMKFLLFLEKGNKLY